jgi:predicted amidophosphoribosyltransferase
MQFATTRTPLGELVYRLKYQRGSPVDIVDTVVDFVGRTWPDSSDCIVTPPPSVVRRQQPMTIVAASVGEALALPVVADAVLKIERTQQMKDMSRDQRIGSLARALRAGGADVRGRRILLLDDVFETGATLTRVAAILAEMGAREIRALVLTRTK